MVADLIDATPATEAFALIDDPAAGGVFGVGLAAFLMAVAWPRRKTSLRTS